MSHTPTPWEVYSKFVGPLVIKSGDTEIAHVGADSFSLCVANAEFIVRAVNAHDELVSLLALVERRIADDLPMPSPDSGLHKRMAAVLAQVRVEL